MKRFLHVFTGLLALIPSTAFAGRQLVPAGTVIQCVVSERLSSKTASVGDPVLCHISRASRSGFGALPYRTFIAGHFEDYKDPGHFVGKGWMELSFDRIIIEPDIIIPIDAKLVDVPGYRIDHQGRILGKGHAVRDTIEWMIPILWPVDLVMLPMRGPRPTLKPETRLTLKLMDDIRVPGDMNAPEEVSPGLMRRESGANYLQSPLPQLRPLQAEEDPTVYRMPTPTVASPFQPATHTASVEVDGTTYVLVVPGHH